MGKVKTIMTSRGMLCQLHHQFKDGHTEIQSQREITSDKEIREWVEETQISHPLPESASWLCCNGKSEYFVITRKRSNDRR